MQIEVRTRSRREMVDITAEVSKNLEREGDGLCHVYVPHTTAAVTINESADPSVKTDILMVINQMVPWSGEYKHMEGNSPAHIKSTLVGASETIALENGNLVLGTWQGIFFCEFDGPRSRKLHVKIMEKHFAE